MPNLASKSQRILSYLIDMILLSAVLSIVSAIIMHLIHFDEDIMEALENTILNDLKKIFTNPEFDKETLWGNVREYLKYKGVQTAIDFGIKFVFGFLYLVLLPFLWKGQTIGRLALKCKVVNKDGSPVTKGKIVLRELLGVCVLYSLFPELYIASLVLICTTKKTLLDYVSSTIMISTESSNPNINSSQENGEQEYMDAEFVEVPNDEKTSENEKDYPDGSSDEEEPEDEYMVI